MSVTKTIYLIACCREKLDEKAPARELYQSEGFKARLAYADAMEHDAIYVLSGKYHLVPLEREIEPYDLNLAEQTVEYRLAWDKHVLEDLSLVSNLKEDRYVILAGASYYEGIVTEMDRFEIPLAGLSHDEAISWLKNNTRRNEGMKSAQTYQAKTNSMAGYNQFPSLAAMAHQAKTQMLTTGDDAFMQKLLQAYPSDGMVHYLYAEALEQKGQFTEASEQYGMAYELFPMITWKNRASEGRTRAFGKLK